jgi:RNA polymerase sigma-70 factor, ECF subfamily
MGTLGLALPWETTIPAARAREKRVESPETDQAHSKSAPGRGAASPLSLGPGVSDPEDAALAAGCQSGDLRAYERLYRLHGARMKSLARNLLSNVSDAEDAVQETFLKIQRGISSFRGQSSFVTWAFRILINTCYDARRRRLRKKEEVLEDAESEAPRPEPRAPGAHPSLRMALERALEELTNQQRDVFLLYEVEGFRHAEIALMLEISETASKNTLFQAKKNLRHMLESPAAAARR